MTMCSAKKLGMLSLLFTISSSVFGMDSGILEAVTSSVPGGSFLLNYSYVLKGQESRLEKKVKAIEESSVVVAINNEKTGCLKVLDGCKKFEAFVKSNETSPVVLLRGWVDSFCAANIRYKTPLVLRDASYTLQSKLENLKERSRQLEEYSAQKGQVGERIETMQQQLHCLCSVLEQSPKLQNLENLQIKKSKHQQEFGWFGKMIRIFTIPAFAFCFVALLQRVCDHFSLEIQLPSLTPITLVNVELPKEIFNQAAYAQLSPV